MAVSDQTPIGGATGNGVTTVFPFDYYVSADSDLIVQLDGVTKTLNVDYTVSGAGDESGGQITFAVAPAVGVSVTHFRNTELTRDINYQTTGDLIAKTLNLDIDRLWLALQEIFSGGKGAPTALRVPPGETVQAFPKAADRANLAPYFDSLGQPVVASPASGTATDVLLQLINTTSSTKGDALIGVKQPLPSARSRTQHDKNRESLSLLDFAVGDGIADDADAIQAAVVAAITNGLNLVAGGRSRFKVSKTIIIPQWFHLNYTPITLDFENSVFVMAADVPLFTSGYDNGGVLTTNWGTTLLSHPSNGITLRRFAVESSVGNITSPAVRVQDWLQGTVIEDIFSGVNYRMIYASNCFYGNFRRVYGTGGNAAVAMNEFSNNCNLMRLESFVSLGASIAYHFTGPVTALILQSMSFETGTAGVGAQFEAAVYDLGVEDSYCEIGVPINYTMLKFNDFVFGATLRNNYFNFNGQTTAYVLEYWPNSTNQIRIAADNAFINFPSNANIIKNREDVYGRGIIIERSTVQGVLADTYVDNAIIGANIDWRQRISLPSGALAKVVNKIIPGHYSGAYTNTFSTAATGFTNNSSGTTLTLNTKIAQSQAMRVAVSLHFVINATDYFTFGEIVPTGFGAYAYFAYTGGGFAPSLIINATFVGGLLQINGVAGSNGLGTANAITSVTGEVRVI